MEYTRVDWPYPIRGMYTELHASHVPPNALVNCLNMYYQMPNRLRSRGGFLYTYAGPAAGAIQHIYYWTRTGELFFSDDNAQLYRNGIAVPGITNDVTDMCSFGVGPQPDLIVCEDTPVGPTMFTWNGAAYNVLVGTDIPRCRAVMTRFSRLFGTRDPDFPSRVYWSDAGDATMYSGAFGQGGYFDVAAGEDGDIVDWLDFESVLYVWKENGLYRIVGDEPSAFVRTKMSKLDGVIPGTIADSRRGILYGTNHGVFPVGVAYTSERNDITQAVEADMQDFLTADARAAYSTELGAYVMVNGGDGLAVSNHNNRPDAWTKFELETSNPTAVYEGHGFWLGHENGNVSLYHHDGVVDAIESSYPVRFRTGDWNLGSALPLKNIDFTEGIFNGTEMGTARVNIYADGAAEPQAYGVLPPALIAAKNLVQCDINCERVALGIEYENLIGAVSYGGAALQMRLLGDVR